MKTKFHHKELGMIQTYYFVISVNRHAFNMATKLKQSRLLFMINNSTSSSNDVDDGQADLMSQQIFWKPQTAIKSQRKNGKNEANWANRDQRRQEPNLEPKQSLIGKQNRLYEQGGKMFCRTCLKHSKKNSMSEKASNFRASTFKQAC